MAASPFVQVDALYLVSCLMGGLTDWGEWWCDDPDPELVVEWVVLRRDTDAVLGLFVGVA